MWWIGGGTEQSTHCGNSLTNGMQTEHNLIQVNKNIILLKLDYHQPTTVAMSPFFFSASLSSSGKPIFFFFFFFLRLDKPNSSSSITSEIQKKSTLAYLALAKLALHQIALSALSFACFQSTFDAIF